MLKKIQLLLFMAAFSFFCSNVFAGTSQGPVTYLHIRYDHKKITDGAKFPP